MIARRECLKAAAAGLGLFSLPGVTRAGAQIEEPLADSVRTALRAAVSAKATEYYREPDPEFTTTEARLAYLRWLGAMSRKLKMRMPVWEERRVFLQTVWYESNRARLGSPHLVLGLIQVESNFRKFARSSAGALGYMQVMPFWTRLIGDGDPGTLFHLQTNLRFGCAILWHYIERERGDLFMALGRYNGSRGKPQYPNAVLAAARAWEFRDLPRAETSPDPTKPLERLPSGPN